MRALASSVSGTFCSTSRIATPSRCSTSMICRICETMRGMSPSVGSSSRMIFGSSIIARAMASICCSPPEDRKSTRLNSSHSQISHAVFCLNKRRRSLNRILGLIINGITTLALIGSVILLVRFLPTHRESPLQLLRSRGLLWLTNVIVFALWYWRLDGGGPTLRHEQKKFGSTSFLFPQMQIPHDERAQFVCARWRPRFVDYLFVAFTQSSTFGPTDAPLLARWAKILAMIQIFISLSIVVLLISRAVGVL